MDCERTLYKKAWSLRVVALTLILQPISSLFFCDRHSDYQEWKVCNYSSAEYGVQAGNTTPIKIHRDKCRPE